MALWTLSGFWMKGKRRELCTMPSTRNIATYQTECAVSQRKGTSEDRQTPEQKGPPRSFFAKPSWLQLACCNGNMQ